MDRSQFFELSLDLHCVADLGGRFTWVGPRFTEVLGWSQEELFQRPFLELVHPDDRDATETAMAALRRGEAVMGFENRYRAEDGSYRWLEWSSAPDPGEGRTYATARDVTGQKRIREELEASRAALQEAQEIACLGSWVWTLPTDEVTWSDQVHRIFGTDPERFTPSFEAYLELVHPEDRRWVRQDVDAALASDRTFSHECRIVKGEGEVVWIHARGRVTGRDGAGAPTRMEGTAQEITRRKEAEEELRALLGELEERVERRTGELRRELEARGEAERKLAASERHHRKIVENAPVGMVRATLDGEIRAANQEWARIIGYASVEEALDDHGTDAFAVYGDPGEWDACLRDLRDAGSIRGREMRLRTKDGEEVWTRIDAVVEQPEGAGGAPILGFVYDITRERSLKQQVLHGQKMEALGTMAGGVAHDFNNILTVIRSNSELLLDAGDPGTIRELTAEILHAARQGEAVTDQLLTFSRQAPTVPEVVDLNDEVEEMRGVLDRLLGDGVALVADLAEDVPRVRVDPRRLEQVIMNLVLNARDAMPGGGEITLGTRRVELDLDYAEGHLEVEPGPRVLLSVADTGHGMDEATVERIFEPFFTTKESGDGTGLGLSTVRGIVEEAGGYVMVYSEEGEGTTFKVYLPPMSEAGEMDHHEDREAEAPRQKAEPAEGTELILLVEDDEAIRRSGRRILESLGYRVLEAADADKARAAYRDSPDPIDLAMVDVGLPDMKGPDLVERLREARRGLPALFVSGFTGDELVNRKELDEGAAFLSKPYSRDDLAAALRKALGG